MIDTPGQEGEDDRRKFTRANVRLRVNFRVMDSEEAFDYIEKGDYRSLSVEGGETMGVDGLEHETKDISLGGLNLGGDLSILGDHLLERGTDLAVEILVPGVIAPVKAIAVVVWSKVDDEEKNRYQCGLMFKGISEDDIEKLQKCIMRIKKGG